MPPLSESANGAGAFSVTRISPDTVVKASGSWELPIAEALAMEYARTMTTIPIPRLRRTFQRDIDTFIVFDYVEGQQLSACWESLSLSTKLWVACTLRQYVSQLRRLRSQRPGPPGDTPQMCTGTQFMGAYLNPFKTPQDIAMYLALRLFQTDEGPDVERFCTASRRLVYTHNDLNMRNIILGADGRLWLLDWGMSGFFPEWFEYTAMETGSEDAPLSWKRLVPFMTGPVTREGRQWLGGRRGSEQGLTKGDGTT